MKYFLLTLSLCGFLSACSSAPKVGVEHAGEETILSRMDDAGSRPDWLIEAQPFRIEGSQVHSMGMTVIPASDNLSAAYRIAENNAKSLVSHSIEQRLDYVFQNAEEGTVLGANQARYIGAEASKLTTSSLRPARRFWEKVHVVQENGQPTVQYRVFALVEMPESDFRAAIIDALRRSQGKQGISQDFAKKVDAHWNQFVGAPVEPRQPSGQ